MDVATTTIQSLFRGASIRRKVKTTTISASMQPKIVDLISSICDNTINEALSKSPVSGSDKLRSRILLHRRSAATLRFLASLVPFLRINVLRSSQGTLKRTLQNPNLELDILKEAKRRSTVHMKGSIEAELLKGRVVAKEEEESDDEDKEEEEDVVLTEGTLDVISDAVEAAVSNALESPVNSPFEKTRVLPGGGEDIALNIVKEAKGRSTIHMKGAEAMDASKRSVVQQDEEEEEEEQEKEQEQEKEKEKEKEEVKDEVVVEKVVEKVKVHLVELQTEVPTRLRRPEPQQQDEQEAPPEVPPLLSSAPPAQLPLAQITSVAFPAHMTPQTPLDQVVIIAHKQAFEEFKAAGIKLHCTEVVRILQALDVVRGRSLDKVKRRASLV